MNVVTERSELAFELPDSAFVAFVELLPPGFPYDQSKWENDDRSLEVPNVSGSIWCRVFERETETQIAYAFFAADVDVVRCDDVHVEEHCRRKGIADFLYRLVAKLFDAEVVPSDRLLEGGKKFWNGRTRIVP